eukprot:scaffold114738_cov66-Phaeocystis_antarctica.AAC.1
MVDTWLHAAVRGLYTSAVLRAPPTSVLPPRTYTRRCPKAERGTECPASSSDSRRMSLPSLDSSAGQGRTVVCRKPASIAAKRTCFIAASSSASGRSVASHHRTIHWNTASSFLTTSSSSCTSASTCPPDADCGGSSSKPPRADLNAAFSSAGSMYRSASRQTSSALHGASRAWIAPAHASLSGSITSCAAASSISVSRSSSTSHEPS